MMYLVVKLSKAIRDLPLLPSRKNPRVRRHQIVTPKGRVLEVTRPESREEWLQETTPGERIPAVLGISREMNRYVQAQDSDFKPTPRERPPRTDRAESALEHLAVRLKLDEPLKRQPRRTQFEKNYEQFDEWAWQSVFHQIGKGQHIRSLDDAYLAAMEEAFLAMKRYDRKQGGLAPFIRPAMKFGIIKHMIWERSRGVTGTRDIESKYYAATTVEEREKVIEQFPGFTELSGAEAVPSTEEAILGAQVLLQQKRNLAARQRNTNKKLDQVLKRVSTILKKHEAKRKTHKRTSYVKRNLKIFEMKMIDQKSYGEIAKKLKMDRGEVAKQFKEIMAEIRLQWTRKALTLLKAAWSRDAWLRARLALNLKRLIRARKEGYPEEYVDFVREVCEGIMEEIAAKRA